MDPGTQLGPYEILEPLGKGGMGEVYRARDTRLDRDVAVKVLPDEFTSDAERLARFEREAKLLASLNHPNIGGIYGLEEANGVQALVLELVEGPRLADRIAEGPLPIDEALPIAKQIAEALEAAHERGIIHRDLKPANIKLKADGTVKVLDFGLAKAYEPEEKTAEIAGDLSASPTKAVATKAGMILGTAAYMSPEQARGEPVDKRTDIWAFGCVLFEMLTGDRLFGGASASDVLASVLRTDLDWDRLPQETPSGIRRLLRRCLARDPDRRLRDFGDVRIELEDAIAGDPIAAETAKVRTDRRTTLTWLAAAGLLILLIAAVTWNLRPTPVPRVERLTLAVPDLRFGYPYPAKVSPDGLRIAFSRGDRLWIRDLDRLESRPVDGSEGAESPFWSPDSQWLGFVARGRVWKVPVSGGERVVITRAPDAFYAPWGGDLSWGDHGTLVISTGWAGLYTVPASGGEVSEWLAPAEGDLDFHDPSWLPDERGVLFNVHRAEEGMSVLAVYDGEKRSTLLELPGDRLHGPVYARSGHILFHRGGRETGVWAIAFDLDSLEAEGDPFPVLPDGGRPSVADDGTLVTIHGATFLMRVAQVGRTGRPVEAFGDPVPLRYDASLSPDGRRVAYNFADVGNEDIWSLDLETGARVRLTFGRHPERFARWSPDGMSLVYECTHEGVPFVCRIPADGASKPVAVHPGFTPSFNPDGGGIVFKEYRDDGTWDLVHFPAGASEPEPVVQGLRPGAAVRHDVSPDGKFLAYHAAAGEVVEVFVTRLPDGAGRWQVSFGGGMNPRWSREGNRLYFAREREIMVADVDLENGFRAGTARPLFDDLDPSLVVSLLMAFDEMPDDRGFMMLQDVTSTGRVANLVVFRNWQAAMAGGPTPRPR